MARSYVTTDMHEQLVEFVLQVDATHNAALFDGGAIIRPIGEDCGLVVMVTPEAEAETYSPLRVDDDTLCLIEEALSEKCATALHELGIGDWVVTDHEDEARDLPGLEFHYIAPELAPA